MLSRGGCGFLEGTIIRATGGFFLVRDEQGREHLCRPRGKLKRQGTALLVGDRVRFRPGPSGSETGSRGGLVEELLPRANCLYRPPVANVDRLVLVMALAEPAPDWLLACRMLVLAERQGMASLVCLNKVDLLQAEELEQAARLLEPYPYPCLFTSALLGRGIKELKKQLQEGCSVFAGPSGAGKSSLLNAVQPGLSLKTRPVSEKVKRGRHTTRMAELLPLEGGGMVVDTPGFSRLDLPDMEPAELATCFPEIGALAGRCPFRNCTHIDEPDCAVREAAAAGRINRLRYRHYRQLYRELTERSGDYKCR